MAEKLVRIEGENGRRVTVTERDYAHKKMAALKGQTYKDAGYTVVSYEDGTPYGEGGGEPTSFALADTSTPIGEGGSAHTDIDGKKLTAAQLTAAGVTAPERSTARRTQPEPAPKQDAPAAPAQ
jgi:hypothetical protein